MFELIKNNQFIDSKYFSTQGCAWCKRQVWALINSQSKISNWRVLIKRWWIFNRNTLVPDLCEVIRFHYYLLYIQVLGRLFRTEDYVLADLFTNSLLHWLIMYGCYSRIFHQRKYLPNKDTIYISSVDRDWCLNFINVTNAETHLYIGNKR